MLAQLPRLLLALLAAVLLPSTRPRPVAASAPLETESSSVRMVYQSLLESPSRLALSLESKAQLPHAVELLDTTLRSKFAVVNLFLLASSTRTELTTLLAVDHLPTTPPRLPAARSNK